MESVVRVKKSMKTPIRKLTSCVSGVKERRLCARPRNKRSRGGGERGGCNRLGRRTSHQRSAQHKKPAVIPSYQADLEKERRQREAMNAQKNAERAAMRAHFRRKYQLSEDSNDTNHLRSVGGKVSLPHELSRIIHPETKTKDNSFNILRAFQGLNLGTPMLTGRKPSKTSAPMPANEDTCKVM
ncbi:complexin-3-like [Halichoeres trimaculatus]|uniref:complexin-3-like n=1 Tax=Halichoeres trimaculatus TaxID=147232 RepID=UPI003D9DF734